MPHGGPKRRPWMIPALPPSKRAHSELIERRRMPEGSRQLRKERARAGDAKAHRLHLHARCRQRVDAGEYHLQVHGEEH